MRKLELKRGQVLRLEGPLSMRLEKGVVRVSGGRREKGVTVKIPKAKSIPLEAETDATMACWLGREGKIEVMLERTIPREWDALVAEVVRSKPRKILVIGDIDAGKTFFTTYLGNSLLEHGVRMAAIDGDVGQADIGPPTTIGIGIFEEPVALLHEVPLSSIRFVGSTSPSGHMLEFLVGVKRLLEKVPETASVVTINTPGWITGAGRALQLALVELIRPKFVVALQRGDELDHLLAGIGEAGVRKLAVSKAVRPRTPSERAFLRRSIFAEYFKDARRFTLDIRTLSFQRCYFQTGKTLDLKIPSTRTRVVHAELTPEGVLVVSRGALGRRELNKLRSEFGHVKNVTEGSERNLLVGLANGENDLLGLGIIDEIDYIRKRIAIITPLRETSEVKLIQFGSMRIRPDGAELESLKPWSF